MLTHQQKLSLKSAAKLPDEEKMKEINRVTELLKLTSPSSFHFYDADGSTSESMKMRRFFDEPYSLRTSEFLSYEVQFRAGKQTEVFENRNKKLLRK
jgi:hypothetical protein